MRALPWLLVGLLVWGCASSPVPPQAIHRDEDGPPGAKLLVRRVLEETAGSPVVFLPAELLDASLSDWTEEPQLSEGYSVWFVALEETDSEQVEPATARRPPRGSGPLMRRPPGPRLRVDPPLWRSYQPPPQRTARAIQEAQQQYYRKLAEAQLRYPKHQGYHHHHAIPIYLGGAKDGVTYWIPAAYHEAITQAFRKKWGYGQKAPPRPEELFKLLTEVYSEHPIPQLIGITP